MAMTAGNHVLVTRVQSIVPINWRRRALIFHSTLTALRLIIGIVDVALVRISNYPDGTCKYSDEEFVSDLKIDMSVSHPTKKKSIRSGALYTPCTIRLSIYMSPS